MLHIGKSSAGWVFSLHVTDEVRTFEEWQQTWNLPGVLIYDEYGAHITPTAMCAIILERHRPHAPMIDLGKNQAVMGPNNLLRHMVDGHLCIGHGAGTYDYITGEFC